MITSSHISDLVITSFCSGALSAADTIMCAEHLEMCHECSIRFNNIVKSGQYSRPIILDFSPKTYLVNEHLAYEQLGDYLDGALDEDETEIIHIHVELCPGCYKNLSSLEEFRKAVEPELRVKYGPRDLLQGVAAFLQLFRYPRLIWTYSALVVLVILGCLAVIFHSRLGLNPSQDADVSSSEPPLTAETQPPNREGIIQPLPLQADIKDRKMRSSDLAERRGTGIYDKGRWYGLDHKGNPVGLQAIPSDIRGDVVALLRGQDLNIPGLLDELRSPDVNERGLVENKRSPDVNDRGLVENKGKAVLLGPLGTLIVEDRPSFKWKQATGADSYIVEIADDSFDPVTQSPMLTTTEWIAVSPLKRNRVYVWQVAAFKNGKMIEDPVRQTGRFKIASAAKLDEIEKARKQYASHLARGVFYVKEGLLDEAEREFQALLNRNPESALARSIFRKIQTRSDMPHK